MPVIAAGIVAALLGALFGTWLAKKGGRAGVAGALAYLAAWINWAAWKVLPEISQLAAQLFVSTFSLTRAAWGPALAVLFREIIGADIDLEALRTASPETTLRALFTPIAGKTTQALLDAMAPQRAITPEDAASNISSLLGLGIGINISGWWMEFLADASTLGHLRAFVDLRRAIDQSLALQRLGYHLWTSPMKKGISEPLEILYNRIYQLGLLGQAELVEAHLRGLYPIDQYLDAMRDHGVGFQRAIDLANIKQTLLSVSEATALWRQHMIDGEEHLRLIKHHGYGDERARFVQALEQGKELDTIIRSIAMEARTLWRHGELTTDELRQQLTAANFRDYEIDAILTLEEVQLRNTRRLSEAQIFEAYRDGLLSEQEVRTRLRSRGFDDEDIDVLIGLQRKKLTPADTLELYSRGLMDRDEAESRLVRAGYSPDDALRLLSLRLRTLTQGQVLDALRGGLLNLQGAREALQRLAISPEAIDIIIAFAQRRLSTADVQGAVLRGLLTPEQGLARLVGLGFAVEDAQLIIELRTRLFTTGETVDLYGAGFLSRADATRRLEQLGFTADEADLLIRLEEAKLARQQLAPGAPAVAARAHVVRPRRARTPAAPPTSP